MAGAAERTPLPDAEADAAAFEEWRPLLFGIAYRMLGSAADAEDVVQDACVRWLRRGDTGSIGGTGVDGAAPPRPGTAKYDEYMKERERKRLIPAAERGEETQPVQSSGLDPVH